MRGNILILLLLPLFSLAQTNSGQTVSVSYKNLSNQWAQIHIQDGVMFYAEIADCNRPEDGIYQQLVLLKLVNTTEFDFTVSWDVLQWYDDTLWTRLPVRPENQKQLILKGGEMLEGQCDINSKYYDALTLFGRFLNYNDKPEMTKFELSNIKISRNEN